LTQAYDLYIPPIFHTLSYARMILLDIYYPLFQFIQYNESRHSKLKASKVLREEEKLT
jgi:hypothetical protein